VAAWFAETERIYDKKEPATVEKEFFVGLSLE
jgi:hypothetical protein